MAAVWRFGGIGWRRVVGALMALMTVLATATAASAQPLKLGYIEFPPYTYTEGGVGRGSLLEVFDKVAQIANFAYVAEGTSPQHLFQGIVSGQYDVFLGIKSAPAFNGTVLASARPITSIELNAYAVDAAPAPALPDGLSGKTVIVVAGYTYGGWRAWLDDPANRVEVVEARNADQALALLAAGRGEILLQYALPMQRALAAQPLANLRESRVSVLDVHFVVSGKTRDAAGLLARLEAAYARINR